MYAFRSDFCSAKNLKENKDSKFDDNFNTWTWTRHKSSKPVLNEKFFVDWPIRDLFSQQEVNIKKTDSWYLIKKIFGDPRNFGDSDSANELVYLKLFSTFTYFLNSNRKAVKATVILLPLFGLHWLLTLYRPSSGNCILLSIYKYLNITLDGLQGLMVAIAFCYRNAEVSHP